MTLIINFLLKSEPKNECRVKYHSNFPKCAAFHWKLGNKNRIFQMLKVGIYYYWFSELTFLLGTFSKLKVNKTE